VLYFTVYEKPMAIPPSEKIIACSVLKLYDIAYGKVTLS
jgi:hypothetical protein